MKQKERSQISSEQLVTIYELVEAEGRVIGIGNSRECGISEALELIKAGKAKAEHLPIGDLPSEWGGKSGGGE
jgi:hypothetical protein